MVLRVRPKLTRFPTKILCIPMDKTPLPVGLEVAVRVYSFYKGYNISCGRLRLLVTAFILFLGMEMDSVD